MAFGVDIRVEEEGDFHVVTLDGRVDASSTPVLEKKLAGLFEASKKILVDFSGVSYLSSAGLRFLLSATKKMKAKDGIIGFFGFADDVIEIIKMAGFERILNIFPTKKEALKKLK